ncbi:hypothetical protein GCM10027074_67060 [Streptomyces deserti]
MRSHHGGVKRFHHSDAGSLGLIYQPLDLPMSVREAHSLTTILTAHPAPPTRLGSSSSPAERRPG